ncbi:type VII secretion system-associated protein [Streptomyces sp. NPDC056656]|uniref:type VII secretion system-associated protein n=1 Tax=Streptomyces sp. NPDC056656 TaxID=3345895 RepID=UPI0036A19FD7
MSEQQPVPTDPEIQEDPEQPQDDASGQEQQLEAQEQPETQEQQPQAADENDSEGGGDDADGTDDEDEWPQELLDAGKIAPDHWIRIIDPAWDGDGEPPEWAVGGVWRSDEDGNIVEGQLNEEYKPSPAAMGWPAPMGPLDEAVQLAATGYISEDTLARELAGSEVLVFVDEDGEPAVVRAPDGSDVVAVSAASVLVDEETNPHVRMPVAELLKRTQEASDLYFLSPSAPVSIVVPVETLLDAAAERSGSPRVAAAGPEAPVAAGSAPQEAAESGAPFDDFFAESGLEAPLARPTESGGAPQQARTPDTVLPAPRSGPRLVEDLALPGDPSAAAGSES